MTYTEQYREYIECTFNGFCKTVLYHAAINACRDLRRKQQHEVSLDYLREYHIEPTTTDEYFVVYDVPTVFSVHGETVIVETELLAKALLRLPESRKRSTPCYSTTQAISSICPTFKDISMTIFRTA